MLAQPPLRVPSGTIPALSPDPALLDGCICHPIENGAELAGGPEAAASEMTIAMAAALWPITGPSRPGHKAKSKRKHQPEGEWQEVPPSWRNWCSRRPARPRSCWLCAQSGTVAQAVAKFGAGLAICCSPIPIDQAG